MAKTAQTRWSPEKAWEWYGRQPWPVGCNFLPSTACNDVEMWQAESFDPVTIGRELGWARDIGLNSVRVFLQFVVWDADPAGFAARLERFVEIAHRHGLTTMPVLFDDCIHSGQLPQLGPQADPVPGVHNSRWVPSPGAKIATDKARWPRLEQYVTELIGQFARDPRIIVWDVYNEPGAGDQFDSRELLDATFDWARHAKPSQPLTAGVFKGAMWEDDLAELGRKDDKNAIMLDRSDVVSFHCYVNLELAQKSVRNFQTAGRPLFCTEWMARGPMESLIQTHLPLWKAERVGCYNWGLVAGRTQTYFPWGSPKGAPEPGTWHHDLLRADGTPFDPQEIDVLRKLAGSGYCRKGGNTDADSR